MPLNDSLRTTWMPPAVAARARSWMPPSPPGARTCSTRRGTRPGPAAGALGRKVMGLPFSGCVRGVSAFPPPTWPEPCRLNGFPFW